LPNCAFRYTGYGYTLNEYEYYEGKWQWHDNKYFFHNLSFGGRFGYHFNWAVKNLDTYAVTTTGWIIHTGDHSGGALLWGVNLGARYFVNDWFGFWVETGYTSFSWFDIGISFKF